MFDNIVFGPFCCYKDDKHFKQITQELIIENWFPLYVSTKGEIYDWITSGVPPVAKNNISGILITFGYLKLYEA